MLLRLVVLLCGFLVLSCARRPDRAADTGRDTAMAAAATDSTDSMEADTTAAPPLRDSGAPAGGGLGRLMIGSWDIFPRGVTGPHLTISVESADGDRFRGRLTRAIAGDVGLDPEQFRPFTGTVGPDSVARLTIRQAAPGAPPVEVRGKVSGSNWRLGHFLWGGDEQVRSGVTWTGRKAP